MLCYSKTCFGSYVHVTKKVSIDRTVSFSKTSQNMQDSKTLFFCAFTGLAEQSLNYLLGKAVTLNHHFLLISCAHSLCDRPVFLSSSSPDDRFLQVIAVISIGFVIVSTLALILSTIPAFQVRTPWPLIHQQSL